MRKGDISNELPKRVLVTTDIFIEKSVTIKKKFKIIPAPKVESKMNRGFLSYLYLYTTNKGVTLELVSFDHTEEELETLTLYLDKMGTNPFRYFTAYSSVEQLVDELPYRPEVIGVVDMPTRLLRYGHWGMELSRL